MKETVIVIGRKGKLSRGEGEGKGRVVKGEKKVGDKDWENTKVLSFWGRTCWVWEQGGAL